MMRRQNLALLGLFLSLATASIVAVRKEPSRGMQRLRLSNTDTASTSRIVLTPGQDAPVVLRRDQDGATWRVQSGHVADRALVSALLNEVRKVNTSDMITQETGRFIDLHVEGDKSVELRLEKSGKVQATLFLGDGSEPGTFYLRQGDTVYRSQGMLGSMARRSEGDWEDRHLHIDGADTMERITVAVANKTPVTLVRATADGDSPGLWQPDGSDAPKDFRFDESQASNLARSLADLRADRLIDEALGDDVTGLAHGEAITWTLTDGQHTQRTLRVGARLADTPGQRYAQIDGEKQIYALNENTAQSLLQSWNGLRALTVMAPTDFDNVAKVTFQLPKAKHPVHFVRNQEGNFVARKQAGVPKGFVSDPHKVRQRAQQALLARAIRFEGPERPRHAIGKSNTGAYTATLQDGTSQSLVFGRALKGDEGSGYYARGSVSQDVYVISRALYDSLMDDLDKLAKKAMPKGAPAVASPGGNGLTPEMEAQIRAQLANSQPG